MFSESSWALGLSWKSIVAPIPVEVVRLTWAILVRSWGYLTPSPLTSSILRARRARTSGGPATEVIVHANHRA